MSCLFCKIIAKEIPAEIIFENEHIIGFLDIGPVSQGHTLVVPKAHAENLSAGSHEDACHLMAAVHHLAPKILQAVEAKGYNLGMNHGECAGQEIMHTHLHIMPRRAGQPRTFTKLRPSKEEIVETAEKIRAAL
ncbi:HIT family protein [bacterium]|nr:HIT family protein [bacterium]